mgnify:CR=1 FL=1
MLNGIFASVYGSSLTFGAFCITTLVSLSLGALLAFAYSREKHSSGSLTRSLLVLPFLVHVVILLVNGNLGAGVAVAGTFSLVRFRSAPGSARDIAVIFLAMTVGLACGMGYAALAVLAAVIEAAERGTTFGAATAAEVELAELVHEVQGVSEEKKNQIQVYIGSESPMENMADCSVVTANYELGNGLRGTIGVIGPKRMDYEKVLEVLSKIQGEMDQAFRS